MEEDISRYLDGMGRRHQGILSAADVAAIRRAVVCIAGTGGTGGHTALAMARIGFRAFRLADPGAFEPSNANRQAGSLFGTMGANKAEVTARQVCEINPAAETVVFTEGVTVGNLPEFLAGCSFAVDGVDLYALPAKRALYNAARERGLPVLSTPIFGFGAALAIFDPKVSPGFDEYFGPLPETDDAKGQRRYRIRMASRFLGFVTPVNVGEFVNRVQAGECPSLGTSTMLAGALGALAGVDLATGRRAYPVVPRTMHIDLQIPRAVTAGPVRRWLFKVRLIWRLMRARAI
jgi:molybdopterin/thiamine biosynthesis adenylyltransferase